MTWTGNRSPITNTWSCRYLIWWPLQPSLLPCPMPPGIIYYAVSQCACYTQCLQRKISTHGKTTATKLNGAGRARLRALWIPTKHIPCNVLCLNRESVYSTAFTLDVQGTFMQLFKGRQVRLFFWVELMRPPARSCLTGLILGLALMIGSTERCRMIV